MSLHDRFHEGLARLNIGFFPQQVERSLAYVDLLQKWNRAYNLTAVREGGQMLTQHILDSLSILPYLWGSRLLDVGAGAGLPGIPLAIGRPDMSVTLLDSNGKKTRFMQQAVLELALDNVEVVKSRLEEYRPARPFDTVTSRAFSSLATFVQMSAPLCGPEGRLLAMKGKNPEQELQGIDLKGFVPTVQRLHVPGLNAERHLICLSKSTSENHD
jgi:16S rRNA (guanine527-N7)-methyltransferase